MKFHYFVPGKVENWVIINDLGGVSVFKIPFSTLNDLTKMLEQNYRTRLYRIYLVNAPWTMKLLFDLFKSLDKNIQKKIHVSGKQFLEQMYEHIEKDEIEQKFGGNKPNLTVGYFPPRN